MSDDTERLARQVESRLDDPLDTLARNLENKLRETLVAQHIDINGMQVNGNVLHVDLKATLAPPANFVSISFVTGEEEQ